MIDGRKLKESLKLNIGWFENSGIMEPLDGSWGVGERVVLCENNDALEKTFTSFPAYVKYGKYAVMEHRRPDCNFETALMFLFASEALKNKKYFEIADNILKYLYFRSGSKNTKDAYPEGVWRWSHEQWKPIIYFDDNAWNSVIALIISRMEPKLEKKYHLKTNGLDVASAMEKAFYIQSDFDAKPDASTWGWAGDLKSPHWGSLTCMAFAYAYRETKEEKYLNAALSYNKYLIENMVNFSTSEYAYILIGASACSKFIGKKEFTDMAHCAADRILAKMDMKTGNVPSEWGKEAPTGTHLIDTIYTQNWVALGLHMFLSIAKEKKYRNAFEKAMGLLLEIQDKSSEKYLNGCWRGMYDMNAKKWGGGNRYEGGADSIYSGWTNAPVSTVIVLELLKKSLF